MSDIKIDKINNFYLPEHHKEKNIQAPVSIQENSKDGVAVSHYSQKLLHSASSYKDPISQQAIENIKNRIQQDDYQIDFDKLSDKLIMSGMIS